MGARRALPTQPSLSLAAQVPVQCAPWPPEARLKSEMLFCLFFSPLGTLGPGAPGRPRSPTSPWGGGGGEGVKGSELVIPSLGLAGSGGSRGLRRCSRGRSRDIRGARGGGHSPALLWAPVALASRLSQEDPEDPARCPGGGFGVGERSGAGRHGATATGHGSPLATPHLPPAPGSRGIHPCRAAPVVLAGLCCSSQTVPAPLASRARQGALEDRVALVGPAREEGDDD